MKRSKRLAFALGVTVAAIAGGIDARAGAATTDGDWVPVPRPGVVRIHLRDAQSGAFGIDPPLRLTIVISRYDAPYRWRQAWGGDGSLAWAHQRLLDIGCTNIVWHSGNWTEGHRCNY